MGAIGEDDCELLHGDAVARGGIDEAQVRAVERRERAELESRVRRLRGTRAPVDLTGRTAVIVDDGIATGVAVQVARVRGAARVVVAAPVAPSEVVAELTEPDEVVVLAARDHFGAVGHWYRDFTPTTDTEVVALLATASADG